jgi:hypothetical protein
MAEIIHIWQIREFQEERRRVASRHREQQSLEGALAVMRESLAVAADELVHAPIAEQPELLDRIEQLTELIRYGIRMVGEAGGAGETGGPAGANGTDRQA